MIPVTFNSQKLTIGDKVISLPEGAKVEIPERKYDKYNFQIAQATRLARERGWTWNYATSDQEGYFFGNCPASGKAVTKVGIIPYDKIIPNLPELCIFLEIIPSEEKDIYTLRNTIDKLLLPGILAQENFLSARIINAKRYSLQELQEGAEIVPPRIIHTRVLMGFTDDYTLS